MLSALEVNLTSSSLFLSDQHEYVVHLLLSSVLLLLLVSLKLWVFKKIHDPLAPACTAVKPAFFRNSPSSRSESAMLSAES